MKPPSSNVQLLESDEIFHSSGLKRFKRVTETVGDLAIICANVDEVDEILVQQFFLPNELDIAERICGEVNSLIKPVFSPIEAR